MDRISLGKEERACVFVLYSIHNVMKAEKILKSQRVVFDTVPVPKEISSDCGMAILSAAKNEGEIRRILTANGVDIKGVYLKRASGYEEKDDE